MHNLDLAKNSARLQFSGSGGQTSLRQSDLKKIIIFSILFQFALFNCGPLVTFLRHPSKNLEYADKELTNSKPADSDQFKTLRKTFGRRQGGHITYDFVKFADNLSFPNDTSKFKDLVKILLFQRLHDLNIDSIKIYQTDYEENNTGFQSDLSAVSGKIYITKSKKKYFRHFSAVCYPRLNGHILCLETYVHLKF